jgi:hypothetical protein
MEFKGGGGFLLLLQRGGLKNDFSRRGGGVFYRIHPLLYFTRPPPLRERIRSSDVRGTGFLKFKKTHLKISRAISCLLSTQVFHKTQFFHRAPVKQYGTGTVQVCQGRCESMKRQETRGWLGNRRSSKINQCSIILNIYYILKMSIVMPPALPLSNT